MALGLTAGYLQEMDRRCGEEGGMDEPVWTGKTFGNGRSIQFLPEGALRRRLQRAGLLEGKCGLRWMKGVMSLAERRGVSDQWLVWLLFDITAG